MHAGEFGFTSLTVRARLLVSGFSRGAFPRRPSDSLGSQSLEGIQPRGTGGGQPDGEESHGA